VSRTRVAGTAHTVEDIGPFLPLIADRQLSPRLHEGNVVFNSRVDTITMKTGKKAEIPVAGMFELDDAGKIRVSRDYFDLATFTKQVS
jgi:limonene-1,2-epoxide hydrolase